MTPNLTCREAIDLLADYLEQSLPPEMLEGFERHLDHCAECVAYVNTYRKTRVLTGTATRVAMPEDLRTRLRQVLLAGSAVPHPDRGGHRGASRDRAPGVAS